MKKNVKELRDYLMDINEEDYALNESFPWLELLPSRYIVVKNKRELYDWAEIMQNCLKSYDEKLKRKQSIIIGYKDYGEILYIAEVYPHSGMVREIKGYKNEHPFRSEELKIRKDIFKSFKKY